MVVSVSLVHPECWIFVPPSQVQEVWHPVLQLLAGAQEKCAAQEVMWQMRAVPGPQPGPTPGRVRPSSPTKPALPPFLEGESGKKSS